METVAVVISAETTAERNRAERERWGPIVRTSASPRTIMRGLSGTHRSRPGMSFERGDALGLFD
jgi:hypothetical protein